MKTRRRNRRSRKLSFDRLERRTLLATNVFGDFNGDGIDDLAIGAPNESIGVLASAGAVNVIYGQLATGLTSVGNQFWNQNSSGVLDVAEADDRFGSALATGNFNGDIYDDLAIGVPRQDVGTVLNGGAVHILFGSIDGLTSVGNQLWTQDKSGVLDFAEEDDHFGTALATGDFNGDRFDDLAIGVVNEAVGGVPEAGAVNALYGAADGLSSAGNQFWTQNTSGILDVADDGDHFGFALTAGDFDFDGHDDLAVGVPEESLANSDSEEGAVNVIYGSFGSGLASTGNQFWNQNTSGVLDVAEPVDAFGASLAAGDFNGDGRNDLAIGVPLEDVGSVADAGAVNVLYGSPMRLSSNGNQFWNQDSSGILDVAEFNVTPIIDLSFGDFFGASLQSGDFDGDGRDDLAIGVPGESLGSDPFTAKFGAGAVNVIYGDIFGLVAVGNQFWTQDTSGILSTAEFSEVFGLAVGVGDFDDDGEVDLVVGAPASSDTGATRGGAVNVIYGTSTGLSSANNQLWHQNISGILDEVEEDDAFGATLLGGSSLTDIAADFGL